MPGPGAQCAAYIVHGTMRNTLEVISCPYRGPIPCTAQ